MYHWNFLTSDSWRIPGGESFLPPFKRYQPYTEIEVYDCVATQLRPTHCLYVVTMAMTDGNDTPVPGRPSRRWRWATQALRRPPTPMGSQCSGPHRGVVGDRGSTRDQDQIGPFSGRHRSRTPSRENSPTPSDASSGGPAVSGSVGTDRIAVADAAEDGERCWNCNTPNSNYIMSLGDGFFCSRLQRHLAP